MEIISPWALYWILQLDTIGMASSFIAFMGLFAVPFVWGFSIFEVRNFLAYLASSVLTVVWVIAVMAAVFLPSTKNMAAIIVVPAIVNNATVQNEASEIYQLAKQAMRNAVDAKPEPKAEESKAD